MEAADLVVAIWQPYFYWTVFKLRFKQNEKSEQKYMYLKGKVRTYIFSLLFKKKKKKEQLATRRK